MTKKTTLPEEAKARKDIPLVTGCLDYFPAALAEVAHVSKVANDQHNPGEPMHHARGKSTDHADCLLRHLVERGTRDTDGLLHSAKVAWRALALLQEELEAAGAPIARGAKAAEAPVEFEPCELLFWTASGGSRACSRPLGHAYLCSDGFEVEGQ